MSLDDELVGILCCPVSKTPVRRMEGGELETLNQAIAGGRVCHVDESRVEQPLEEGLITEDGKMIYAVDAGIPIMLEEKGIPAAQLSE
jgi:uncharacterized protein YbaR (Trm112 family)